MACLFVDHLTVIDCSYLDRSRGLVGESWIVDLELEGDLDEQSMVLDFGEVKRRIKRAIDSGPDHSLIVPLHSAGLELSHDAADVALRFMSARGRIDHRGPAVALTLLPADTVDAASLAAHLQTQLTGLVPGNVAELRLRLRPETIDGPYYHYSHGLKKHAGACQRIAHGHRSSLRIRVDGERQAGLEAALADRLNDRYIGTREDLVASEDGRLHFAYTAPEGRFELTLPAADCVLIDQDSTVECIAEWLANEARRLEPAGRIAVRAYEGVNKGAFAYRA